MSALRNGWVIQLDDETYHDPHWWASFDGNQYRFEPSLHEVVFFATERDAAAVSRMIAGVPTKVAFVHDPRPDPMRAHIDKTLAEAEAAGRGELPQADEPPRNSDGPGATLQLSTEAE